MPAWTRTRGAAPAKAIDGVPGDAEALDAWVCGDDNVAIYRGPDRRYYVTFHPGAEDRLLADYAPDERAEAEAHARRVRERGGPL